MAGHTQYYGSRDERWRVFFGGFAFKFKFMFKSRGLAGDRGT